MDDTTKRPHKKARTEITGKLLPDLREQLFNERLTGPIKSVATSAERIYELHGLMYDIDPSVLRSGGLLGKIPHNPSELYQRVIGKLIDRSDVLRNAEVRNSGRGLHVILWFDEPVQCDSDQKRLELSCVYDVLIPLLPSDPHQPRLTALTRKVGSINSKSGTQVEVLKAGTPVPYNSVRALAEQSVDAPFKMIGGVLLGGERISPCPICKQPDSSLVLHDHVGHCYGCGQVTLGQVWQLVYRLKKADTEASHG